MLRGCHGLGARYCALIPPGGFGGATAVHRIRPCGLVLAAVLGVSGARAADIDLAGPPFAAPLLLQDPASRWEARFGVFAHGLGGRDSHERGTIDLDGPIVSPRLFAGSTGFWSWFIPRFHAAVR